MQEAFVFLCADGSLRQVRHAQRQTFRHQSRERESFDAGEVPSVLSEARGDPLQCPRSDSLHEAGGGADFSEADRDAMELRKDFWSISGEFI